MPREVSMTDAVNRLSLRSCGVRDRERLAKDQNSSGTLNQLNLSALAQLRRPVRKSEAGAKHGVARPMLLDPGRIGLNDACRQNLYATAPRRGTVAERTSRCQWAPAWVRHGF